MTKIIACADARCVIPSANVYGRSGKGYSVGAVVFYNQDLNKLGEASEYLGEMTVPEAEFNAVVLALENGVEHTRDELEIRIDSELVVRWMNRMYKMRKKHIRDLHDKAKILEQRYEKVSYIHHSREASLAKSADQLAKQKFNEYKK